MVIEFPSIQIWIDLNDSEIFTCAPIEERLMKAYLLFSKSSEAWRCSGSCVELNRKYTLELRFEVR